MPLSVEADKFVKVASASLPRVSEIIAAFSDDDENGRASLIGWAQLASSQTLGTEHKCGITDTLDFYWRPTASTAERRGLCQRLIHARFPAPLPTHRGPVGIANGREQEPAEEGDPSAGSCVCDGRSKIVVNVKL
jgi:hypothetical protein